MKTKSKKQDTGFNMKMCKQAIRAHANTYYHEAKSEKDPQRKKDLLRKANELNLSIGEKPFAIVR